jgi:NAD(P)-dependent dehydrogenase (short-subunit alcohol dehydrogenase family)
VRVGDLAVDSSEAVKSVTDSFRLDGKVAVVTGGSRGLGREIVLGFARAGAEVVVASRKQEACDAVANEVRQATGRRVLPVSCNVGSWDSCDSLFRSACAEFGFIDILVNNAGMSPLYSSDLRQVTEGLWEKVLAVNLGGPFRLSALFGAAMHEGRGGTIINIGSGAGIQPPPEALAYGAAKAGLHALTTGFAQAYGPNVRVNAIVAGRFLTDVSKAWDMDALAAQLDRSQPLGRAGQPGEIVGTALYLASEASSYTTGALIRVDGGAPL